MRLFGGGSRRSKGSGSDGEPLSPSATASRPATPLSQEALPPSPPTFSPPLPQPGRAFGGLTQAAAASRGAADLTAPVCTMPSLRAAEEALISQLAGGPLSPCALDYAALERQRPELRHYSVTDALANRDRNRYIDVLPYNHSRVRLRHLPPGGRDYINASRLVRGGGGDGSSGDSGSSSGSDGPAQSGGSSSDVPYEYIATQGPLDHTRESFWQMVLEQRCSAIVMLTNCVERNMKKCARYFPTQPATKKTFGRFTVKTAAAVELVPDLWRRSMMVADTGSGGSSGGGDRHALYHYHYTAWPDHGVPESAQALLHICEQLQRKGAHAQPIVVHCSAGIGRSGVFCVLDIVTRRLQRLEAGDAGGGAQAVDVTALVGTLRRQRFGMVQTREQFEFCHTALLGYVRSLDAAAAAAAQQQRQSAPEGGSAEGERAPPPLARP